MKGSLMVLGLMLAMLCASVSSASMIQIKGSDTLINLVQMLAEEFMEDNPEAMIAVTGGGSGTGIAALINKKCDIADASRLMKDKEMDMAKDAGVDVKHVIIARDGVCVIVNEKNPLSKLTKDQIGKIYRGEVTNWKEVGGKDKGITLYGRQSSSGTFAFFREVVLDGEYSDKMNRMNGNSQIVEAVVNDETGIGYVGVGYAKEAKGISVLKVAASADADYASPLDAAAVNSGKYPLSRPLNQYLNGKPTGMTKKFIEFELGKKGQAIVEKEGFFPPTADDLKINEKLGL